jgi:hypothetical protein
LHYTNLSATNLSEAQLTFANLTEANLSKANLSKANLSKANLSGAVLYETVLANIDLSHATGLETCRHDGPSVIDFRTLARSHPIATGISSRGQPAGQFDRLSAFAAQPTNPVLLMFHQLFV